VWSNINSKLSFQHLAFEAIIFINATTALMSAMTFYVNYVYCNDFLFGRILIWIQKDPIYLSSLSIIVILYIQLAEYIYDIDLYNAWIFFEDKNIFWICWLLNCQIPNQTKCRHIFWGIFYLLFVGNLEFSKSCL